MATCRRRKVATGDRAAWFRAAVLAGNTDLAPGELARWEDWARAHADRLDPVLSGQVLSHLRAPEPD